MRQLAFRLITICGLSWPVWGIAQIDIDLKSPQNISTHGQIMALQQAGLPYLALTAAQANPSMVSESEMRQLEADYAAELTRLATITTRQESERFRIADKALAMYDDLIPRWQALGPVATHQLQRARIDRLQALNARVRMQDVVDDYEALLRDEIVVPVYALNYVAPAYLYLRQPERAREIYQRILNSDTPDQTDRAVRLNNQIGLFYSLVETEEFDQARTVITDATEQQPVWLTIKGVPQRQPNELRFDAEHTLALSYLYENDTVQAQERLSEMVEKAPNNANLRASLAAAYRARQWPRRAYQELKIAESQAPRAISVVAEQAQTAMDLEQWEQAELLVADLQARAPSHSLTRNVVRDWRSHTKSELNVSVQGGIISDTPTSGKNDLSMETVLYSAPIKHNWRPFAGAGYARGEFDEGKTDFRWMRAGIQWRGSGLTAELEGSTQNFGHGDKVGVAMNAAYDLNDHWQIGASAAFRSTETPVRALHHNITSNSINVFARWRAHDRREWSLAVSAERFSDANQRLSFNLSGRDRLYTTPRFTADAELSVYGSRNSQENAPYFNPRSDFEVVPAINLTHILYRRYETVLRHSFRVGAGIYHQQDHGSGAIGTLAYAMRYHLNNDLDIGATLIGVSRPYDGQRERELRFMLDMNIRF